MNALKNALSSKAAIVGLITTVTGLLILPLAVIFVQDRQDPRQFASETEPETVLAAQEANGAIAGYVYMDTNKNSVRDMDEKPYPRADLRVTLLKKDISGQREAAATQSYDVKTDTYGYFMFKYANLQSDANTLTVRLNLPDGYKATSSNPIVVTKFQKQILEFGVMESTSGPKPSCTPRPACLDSTPRCLIAEPAAGWCPAATPTKAAYPTRSLYPTRPVRITPTFGLKPTATPAPVNTTTGTSASTREVLGN